MWKFSNIMVKDQFVSVERSCPGRSMGQPCSCVFALLYVLVLAAILLLCLVAYSASPHLSLFSYAVRNSCPKLVQSCNHLSPRVNYALVTVRSTPVSSWKLILSFHIFAPKYYKCPPWKFISVCLLNHYFTKASCFPSEILFACVFFWSPSSFKQIKGIESSLWH